MEAPGEDMASLNQGVTVELEVDEIEPSVATRWDANEHAAVRDLGAESAEQTAGCPLLRGILIATIPALLMWAAILGLAVKLL